jgi:hypothetical protein
LKIKGKEYIKRNLPGAQTMIMLFGPISVVGDMGRRKGGGGIVESGGCGEHTNMCKHINDQ